MQFEGDPVLPSGLLHQGVQRVCVAKDKQVALGARGAVWAPTCVLCDVTAELSVSHGHVRVVRVVVGVPEAVA